MNYLNEAAIQSFKTFIDSHDAFYIAGHKEPDGDSISSSLGLAEILTLCNKPFQLLCAGPFKRTEIKKYEKQFLKKPKPFSHERKKIGFFIVDCAEYERVGDFANELQDLDSFIIDHHRTSDAIKNGILDIEAPATSIIIQLLYEHFFKTMSKKIAYIFLFGICTDTGFFRFLDEKSSVVFETVSRLVKYGASPKLIYDEMTGGKPFETRKLLSILLDRAERTFKGQLIYTFETLEDTKKYGKKGRDSDALYQALMAVDKVKVVFVVRQDTDKTCTAGFRSKDDLDVSIIATKFGGGGHKNASGASYTGSIGDFIEKILVEMAKIIS